MIQSIQLLRGIAAYSVVLFHTTEFITANQPSAKIFDFAIGAAGVDLFFVISGFVMVYVTKPSAKPVDFMLRRLIRIAPLYWLCTVSVIGMVFLVPWSFQNVDLSWPSVIMSLTFLPAYNEAELVQPILFLGWTLNYEMFFYCVFALALLLPSSQRLAGIFAGILLTWIIASIFGSGAIKEFYGNAVVFEFLLGCLVGRAVMSKTFMSYVSRGVGYSLIFLALALFVSGQTFFEVLRETDRLVRWGVPSVLMLLGAVIVEMKTKNHTTVPFLLLGDSSYSAYLLHPFIVVIYGTICLRIMPDNGITTLAILIGILVLTAIAATISYKLIEIRFSEWLKTKMLNKGR